MKIYLKKFGEILTSRPSGREALLALQASLNSVNQKEQIEIDFEGIRVFTPSWADEFITPLVEKYGNRIIFAESDNLSVIDTLKFLEEIKNKEKE